MQFALEYDPSIISIYAPNIAKHQDNVIVTSSTKSEGELIVLVVSLENKPIHTENNTILNIPIEFRGQSQDVSQIKIDDIKISGYKGNLIN